MSTELWYTEKQTACHGITTKVVKGLHHEETEFQTIDVFETEQFGKLLSLDGMVMTTDVDEFVYHEMITHVAMNTHPNPLNVLVVGGGDGGVVREVLKHKSVQKIVMAEIDQRVIELSAEYFPQIAKGLTDDRVDIQVGDGFAHVANQVNAYDVIIVDSTEPTGAAVSLFNREFYEGVKRALKDDGIMVAQTDTPWFKGGLVRRLFAEISSVFPITRLYTAAIPTYPSGLWSFTIGSNKYDPLDFTVTYEPLATCYYNSAVHQSAFMLPSFVRELTGGNA